MANNFPNLRPSFSADFVNGIYVDPRITFTRAGTRTYFGREVVKAEENLVLQSQTFDNAYWTKLNTTLTANSAAAPDGTTTADLFYPSSTGVDRLVYRATNIGATASTQYTLSVYAKASGINFLYFGTFGGGTVDANMAFFDLGTGAVGQTGAFFSSASITAVGDGWYRCVATGTTASATMFPVFGASDASGNSTVTASGTDGILIWQAQLEQRSFATAPTVTTTQPITRYQRQLKTAAANEWPREFDPVTGECLGRSVWESRTNRCLYSEEFDNAAWVKTNVTVAANQTIAPDGTLTADQLTASAANGTVIQDLGVVASAAKTGSLYLKRYTGTGNIEITLNGGSSWTAVTLTNTWTRFNLTATLADEDFGIRIVTSGDSIFAWGGMVETGAFQTPYIPTVASQVTRLADSAVMTGVNFSSWFNPEQGTLFVDCLPGTVGATKGLASIDNGTTVNRIQTVLLSNAFASFIVVTNSVSQAGGLSATTYPSGQLQISASYKTNDFKFSSNGAAVVADTDGLVPAQVDRLDIGGRYGSDKINGYIKRLTYYNQALTSANHQAITR
jgi:hypothetical protein